MPDVGGLQLLPETRRKIEVNLPGQNKSLVWSFVFALIILAAYIGLLVYQSSLNATSTSLDNQLAAIEKGRDKATESKLINLSRQLGTINPLLAGHLIWSDAFIKVQSLTLPQMQYETLNTNIDSKKFLYKAIAANYTTVAKQIAAFYSSDAFTDVILDKVAVQPSGRVEFTLELYFNPDKFLLRSLQTK
jgi:hypothetical protein